jgi:hypothetical protein
MRAKETTRPKGPSNAQQHLMPIPCQIEMVSLEDLIPSSHQYRGNLLTVDDGLTGSFHSKSAKNLSCNGPNNGNFSEPCRKYYQNNFEITLYP